MKIQIKLCVIITIFSFILPGCASNADVRQMVYNQQSVHHLRNPDLMHNLSINQVSGGHETNPLWTSKINNANFKEALIESLKQAHLYGVTSKYKVDANLLELKQPFFGMNFTVDCKVHYNILNVKTNKLIFNKDISSSYTATFNDAFYAVARLKIANEGAARENIKKFINELYQLSGS